MKTYIKGALQFLLITLLKKPIEDTEMFDIITNIHRRLCKRNFKCPALCNYNNARFTMVPLNIYMINNVEDIVVFLGFKVFSFDNLCMCSCSRNAQFTFVEKS